MMRAPNTHAFIPGHAEGVSPESMNAAVLRLASSVVMDSGQPLRGFRNDREGVGA
jgi:hypothetical protein